MTNHLIRTLVVSIAAATATFAASAQEATPRTPPGPISEAKVDAFRKADSNGDKMISRQEAARVAGLDRAFGALDTDKNGSLDMNEFAMHKMR